MGLKVSMVLLGCSKNQVDGEILLNLVKLGGFEIVPDAYLADVVIINTCGFIEAAKQESIDQILEFCELKKSGKVKCIIVTGCLAQRYKGEILKEIPELDAVLGIGSNMEIVDVINKAVSGVKVESFKDRYNIPLDGDRILTNIPYFAYIKIAEGCSNGCTYCSIPLIRGKFRSRKLENIISEARILVEKGVRELILIAQDTGFYGKDIYGEKMLYNLINEICEIKDLKWIRILYCYPERIDDKLLDVIANQDKVVKYIDMPMQHVNKDILKNMNRFGDSHSLKEHINNIRIKVPEIVIRSTFITGFPGETEEQFNELLEFLKEVKLERVGCFSYSLEEGTKASKMDNQIDEQIKQQRSDKIMEQQIFIMQDHNSSLVGRVLEVLVEGYDQSEKYYFGRSQYDSPEIDGKVFFKSSRSILEGSFVNVLIEDTLDYDLIGKILLD